MKATIAAKQELTMKVKTKTKAGMEGIPVM